MDLKSTPEPAADGERLLAIGELAERVGVRASSLRYYDEIGLVRPAERRGGRRCYEAGAVEEVGAVLFLSDVGFGLGEIASVKEAAGDRVARRSLIERKIAELERQRVELDAALEALRHSLECPADDITSCPSFRGVVRERLAARRSWTATVAETHNGQPATPTSSDPR